MAHMTTVESGVERDFRNGVQRIPVIPRKHNLSLVQGREPDVPEIHSEIRGDEFGDVLLSLFERSGIGLAILDPNLRVRSINSAFSAQSGWQHDEIKDRGFAEFLHPSVRQQVLRQFCRLVQGQQARVVSRSIAMWFHDTAVSGKLTAYPIQDTSGKVKMVLVQSTPVDADDNGSLVGAQWKLTSLTAKILEGVAAGDPTVRLAAKLFLSRQGIEYHVSILLRQFKVPNRTALAAKAYSMGMFSLGAWPPKVLPDYIRADRQSPARSRTEAQAV
jgi:PAS domain S-box-containing protein